MSDARRPALLAAAGALLVASAAGVTLWQLSRVLWGVLNSSYEETQRAMVACTARINSDSPDEDVPEELYLVDDQAGVYVYEGIQDLYWRRGAPGAPSDWEWSYDMQEFHSTDDLAMDHALYLDPPAMIFILRMHLISALRRKVATAGAPGSIAGRGGASKARARIPPPVELPAWAAQQLAEQQAPARGGAWQPPSSSTSSSTSSSIGSSASGQQRRQLLDAPDALCCPISGQLMLQPVSTPSGTTFDYDSVRHWISTRGSDPTTLAPLSLHELYPNLLVRAMVERWLAGGDVLSDGDTAAGGGESAGGCSTNGSSSTTHAQQQQQQAQQHKARQRHGQQQASPAAPARPPPAQQATAGECAPGDSSCSGSGSAGGGVPHRQRQQQQQQQQQQSDDDEEDLLSSFGATPQSGSSEAGGSPVVAAARLAAAAQ